MALSVDQAHHDTSKHADKVFNRDEARFLDVERAEATSLDDNQSQVVSPSVWSSMSQTSLKPIGAHTLSLSLTSIGAGVWALY